MSSVPRHRPSTGRDGASLAPQPVGVASLWIAVVTGWVWLGAASTCADHQRGPYAEQDRPADAYPITHPPIATAPARYENILSSRPPP
jgi:hypothetical protein